MSIMGVLQIVAGTRGNTGGCWGKVLSRLVMPDVKGSGRWGPLDDGHVKQRFDLVLGNLDVDAKGCHGKDEGERRNG